VRWQAQRDTALDICAQENPKGRPAPIHSGGAFQILLLIDCN
jgi:hypothetical protein